MIFKDLLYQKKAVKDICDFYNSWNSKSKPGIAVLPTGSGKSVIQALSINKLKINALVIQPSVELLEQNYEKYIFTGNKASLFSASVNSKEVGNVTYATGGSIKDHASKFTHLDLIVIDECHIGTTPEKKGKKTEEKVIVKFIKELEGLLKRSICVIGLTATATKLKSYAGMDYNYSKLMIINRVQPRFFGKIFHITQIQEVREENMLCDLRFTTFKFDKTNIKIKGNDYEEESMAQEMYRQGIVEKIIDLTLRSIKKGKRKILIFAPTLDTAEYIKTKIPNCQIVTGKTPKSRRRGIIENYREDKGEAKVLINWGTLTTGFDVRNVDLLICGRSTMSFGLWYQIAGRGMRVYPGKELCDILDLSGNYDLFGDPLKTTYYDHPVLGMTLLADDYIISGIPVGMKVHIDDYEILDEKVNFGKYRNTDYRVKEIPANYFKYVQENGNLKSRDSQHMINILKKINLLNPSIEEKLTYDLNNFMNKYDIDGIDFGNHILKRSRSRR